MYFCIKLHFCVLLKKHSHFYLALSLCKVHGKISYFCTGICFCTEGEDGLIQGTARADPDSEKHFLSINLRAFWGMMNELINEPFYLLL